MGKAHRRNGLWSRAIAFLHARRYSDAAIAELFNEILHMLREILDTGLRWSIEAQALVIDPLLLTKEQKDYLKRQPEVCYWLSFDVLQEPVLWWTTKQVWYHRTHTLGIPRNRCPRVEYTRFWEASPIAARIYAARFGWGHLLPYFDEETRKYVPGIDLKRRETDILTVLTEHGPLTRLQLCRLLHLRYGNTALYSRGRSYLHNLLDHGLINASGCPKVYTVVCTVRRRTKRPDGIAMMLKKMAQVFENEEDM